MLLAQLSGSSHTTDARNSQRSEATTIAADHSNNCSQFSSLSPAGQGNGELIVYIPQLVHCLHDTSE